MASIIAGFAFSGLIVGTQFTGISLTNKKITPTNLSVSTLYFAFASASIGTCLLACVICTVINVRGPGLALRGPDGSLKRAVDSMRQWQRYALYSLTIGVCNFHLEGMTYAWLMLSYRANAVTVTVILGFVLILMLLVIYTVFRDLNIMKHQLQAGELTDAQLTAIVRRLQGGGSKINPSSGSYISDYGATEQKSTTDEEGQIIVGTGLHDSQEDEAVAAAAVAALQQRGSSSFLQPYLDSLTAHVGGASSSFGEDQEDEDAVKLAKGSSSES
eukprot:CAMPEP_0197292416 /NCGR_PEP_ID=MMETSP0890-20130614/23202_1 /TAXON_ID=44058 ORGANISM="Aureoumbra lagunensis, Strain CCMP1510" /NCGR_SAMPLE_ID=MMETSP0890 /ASSEMBLY_ACC=CAM_ASM_000533 /LENGTH=272 /DNA_ID=CAMNT_0042766313 /DNA_START=188 /DNA_END=1006 /DNA_ORIENTATION=-